jgi:predicted XRE-type DNA-binding protein
MPNKHVKKLYELANTIRSKNAGVNQITFDIIFSDKDIYEKVKKTKAITKSSIASLYGIDESRISDFVEFDVANAIKFTVYRLVPGGSPGDWDILGCQQYGPLLNIEIPFE